MTKLNWKLITDTEPSAGQVVLTKIHDNRGQRNIQELKRMEGNTLWWHPDGSMYVYYTPTHYVPANKP